MGDLVEWFAEANGFSNGTKAPHKWVLQAEQELRIQSTALTEAAATIARLEAKVSELQAGLQEALDWNWLDDDAPEHVRERLWLLSQPEPGKGEED